MGDVITRKCACCKGEIVVDKSNISNVIFFNKLYYHTSCFEDMATKKAASKRGKPQMWQDALDKMWELEAETKRILEAYIARDELNEWLLEHYDIIEVPGRFWQIVADLEMGKYKKRKCKPISTSKLYGCWKWGQKKLDKISVGNKMSHKGPTNDVDRLRYDLAILITKYPLYLKHESNMSVIESVASFEDKQPKIDYSILARNNSPTTDGDNDILDLMGEIFEENEE